MEAAQTDVEMNAKTLVLRGIESIESTRGRLEAVEKSVDAMQLEVRAIAMQHNLIASYIERIAKAEEARAQQAKKEHEEKSAWLQKLWASPGIQLLFMGLILALLQTLGMQQLVSMYVKDDSSAFHSRGGGVSP